MRVIISRETVFDNVHYSLMDNLIINHGDREYYSLSVDDMKKYKLYDEGGRVRVSNS